MLIMKNGGFALVGLARAVAARYRCLAAEIDALADGAHIDLGNLPVIERWSIDANGGISGDLVEDGERRPVWTGDIVVWDRDAGLIRTPEGWFLLVRSLQPGDVHPGPSIDLEAAMVDHRPNPTPVVSGSHHPDSRQMPDLDLDWFFAGGHSDLGAPGFEEERASC